VGDEPVTSPIDDGLKRASAAVRQYRVPDPMIDVAAGALVQMPDGVRQRSEIHALTDAILEVADKHGGIHDRCPTCDSIANGLAVTMGILRAEVDLEFRQRLDG
jgi:hypothetical protein